LITDLAINLQKDTVPAAGDPSADDPSVQPKNDDPQKIAEIFNNGVTLLKNKDWDAAAAEFLSAASRDPNNGEAYYMAGVALSGKQDWNSAAVALQNAISRGYETADVYTAQGVACTMTGKGLPETMDAFQKAIAADPNRADARGYLAGCYAQQGQTDKAVAEYARALELQVTQGKDPSEITRNIGSRPILQAAIAAMNGNAKAAWAAREISAGEEQQSRGQWQAAIDSYRNATSIEPAGGRAYYLLGAALKETAQFNEAVSALEKAVANGYRTKECYFTLGQTYNCVPDSHDKARDAFANAVRQGMNNADVYTGLGIALRETKDLEGAIVAFKKALELDPNKSDTKSHYDDAVKEYARQGGDVNELLGRVTDRPNDIPAIAPRPEKPVEPVSGQLPGAGGGAEIPGAGGSADIPVIGGGKEGSGEVTVIPGAGGSISDGEQQNDQSPDKILEQLKGLHAKKEQYAEQLRGLDKPEDAEKRKLIGLLAAQLETQINKLRADWKAATGSAQDPDIAGGKGDQNAGGGVVPGGGAGDVSSGDGGYGSIGAGGGAAGGVPGVQVGGGIGEVPGSGEVKKTVPAGLTQEQIAVLLDERKGKYFNKPDAARMYIEQCLAENAAKGTAPTAYPQNLCDLARSFAEKKGQWDIAIVKMSIATSFTEGKTAENYAFLGKGYAAYASWGKGNFFDRSLISIKSYVEALKLDPAISIDGKPVKGELSKVITAVKNAYGDKVGEINEIIKAIDLNVNDYGQKLSDPGWNPPGSGEQSGKGGARDVSGGDGGYVAGGGNLPWSGYLKGGDEVPGSGEVPGGGSVGGGAGVSDADPRIAEKENEISRLEGVLKEQRKTLEGINDAIEKSKGGVIVTEKDLKARRDKIDKEFNEKYKVTSQTYDEWQKKIKSKASQEDIRQAYDAYRAAMAVTDGLRDQKTEIEAQIKQVKGGMQVVEKDEAMLKKLEGDRKTAEAAVKETEEKINTLKAEIGQLRDLAKVKELPGAGEKPDGGQLPGTGGGGDIPGAGGSADKPIVGGGKDGSGEVPVIPGGSAGGQIGPNGEIPLPNSGRGERPPVADKPRQHFDGGVIELVNGKWQETYTDPQNAGRVTVRYYGDDGKPARHVTKITAGLMKTVSHTETVMQFKNGIPSENTETVYYKDGHKTLNTQYFNETGQFVGSKGIEIDADGRTVLESKPAYDKNGTFQGRVEINYIYSDDGLGNYMVETTYDKSNKMVGEPVRTQVQGKPPEVAVTDVGGKEAGPMGDEGGLTIAPPDAEPLPVLKPEIAPPPPELGPRGGVLERQEDGTFKETLQWDGSNEKEGGRQELYYDSGMNLTKETTVRVFDPAILQVIKDHEVKWEYSTEYVNGKCLKTVSTSTYNDGRTDVTTNLYDTKGGNPFWITEATTSLYDAKKNLIAERVHTIAPDGSTTGYVEKRVMVALGMDAELKNVLQKTVRTEEKTVVYDWNDYKNPERVTGTKITSETNYADGRLRVETETQNGKGQTTAKTDVTTDNNGRVLSETIYSYDAKGASTGRVEKEYEYGADGKLGKTMITTYNAEGRPQEKQLIEHGVVKPLSKPEVPTQDIPDPDKGMTIAHPDENKNIINEGQDRMATTGPTGGESDAELYEKFGMTRAHPPADNEMIEDRMTIAHPPDEQMITGPDRMTIAHPDDSSSTVSEDQRAKLATLIPNKPGVVPTATEENPSTFIRGVATKANIVTATYASDSGAASPAGQMETTMTTVGSADSTASEEQTVKLAGLIQKNKEESGEEITFETYGEGDDVDKESIGQPKNTYRMAGEGDDKTRIETSDIKYKKAADETVQKESYTERHLDKDGKMLKSVQKANITYKNGKESDWNELVTAIDKNTGKMTQNLMIVSGGKPVASSQVSRDSGGKEVYSGHKDMQDIHKDMRGSGRTLAGTGARLQALMEKIASTSGAASLGAARQNTEVQTNDEMDRKLAEAKRIDDLMKHQRAVTGNIKTEGTLQGAPGKEKERNTP